jgi:hypothetical protein
MPKDRMTDWDLLKAAADTPAEIKELNNIELENLKSKQMFHSSTPAEERKLIMKNNRDLRKKAKKILRDEAEVKRFMESTNFDEYLNITKRPKLYEVGPLASPEIKNDPVPAQGLDTIIYKGPPDKDVTPESEFMRVPEFIETYMKKSDVIADDSFGIGSVEKPNDTTLEAIRDLKK